MKKNDARRPQKDEEGKGHKISSMDHRILVEIIVLPSQNLSSIIQAPSEVDRQCVFMCCAMALGSMLSSAVVGRPKREESQPVHLTGPHI
ncbi:hypothetical protein SDJN03_07024, partial [Cucurbita argyrosperma subsp. sororia]